MLYKKLSEIEQEQQWSEGSESKNIFVEDNGNIRRLDANAIGGMSEFLEEISVAELRAKAENGELVPGKQYRIIDYTCTVNNEVSSYARVYEYTDDEGITHRGHPFDIIVVADDKHTLNENARAIQSKDDAYYDNCELNTWELKYSLFDDASKFEWADEENGKGVIYYLKDDRNNEATYDFKQIQFKRYYTDADISDEDIEGGNFSTVTWYNKVDYQQDENDYVWLYTFSAIEFPWYDDYENTKDYFVDLASHQEFIEDATVLPIVGIEDGRNICENNVIESYNINYDGSTFRYRLNNNVMLNCYYSDENYFACNSNTFGSDCYSNTFGNNCCYNTFGNYCYSNTFGYGCYSNTFGNYCNSNTFGNSCCYNTFGNDCNSNTFGDNCHTTTFGDHCGFNTLGNECHNNTFSTNCRFNTFGNDCNSNTFGDHCSFNTFGTDCYYNTFEIDCQYLHLIHSGTGNVSNIKVLRATKGAYQYPLEIDLTEYEGLTIPLVIGVDSNNEVFINDETYMTHTELVNFLIDQGILDE